MTGDITIVGKRAESNPISTEEITNLAEANGYQVADEFTQTGRRNSGTYFGDGKLQEIAERAEELGADALVVDDELTPSQNNEIQSRLPETTSVIDRFRLILEIFEEQASTRQAKQQAELEKLKYRLPRVKKSADYGFFNEAVEKGSPVYDLEDRIDLLNRKLKNQQDPSQMHRRKREENGFFLITIAGYTNAGKSTLLHRLCDELDVESTLEEKVDQTGTAEIEDRLFKTLDTTTRKATVGGHKTLVTDTVGFISDLPHDIVKSFSSTLSEMSSANLVLLVVDVSNEVEVIGSNVEVSLDIISDKGVDLDDVIICLNKVDKTDDRKVEQVTQRLPDGVSTIQISAKNGTNIEEMKEHMLGKLDIKTHVSELPNNDSAMSVVSWAYDNMSVHSVEYGESTVQLRVSGSDKMIANLKAKLSDVE